MFRMGGQVLAPAKPALPPSMVVVAAGAGWGMQQGRHLSGLRGLNKQRNVTPKHNNYIKTKLINSHANKYKL